MPTSPTQATLVPFHSASDTSPSHSRYVDASCLTLVFVSKGYFVSPNCMRELLRAVVTGKPVVALLESEEGKGSLTSEEVGTLLADAEAPCRDRGGAQFPSKYAMWGLADEVKSWGYAMPPASELHAALYQTEPIEWTRIGNFQDVSMRLIGERLAEQVRGDGTARDATYMDNELTRKVPSLQNPRQRRLATGAPFGEKCTFHVYCSQYNIGALELMREVAQHARFMSVPSKKQERAKRVVPSFAQRPSANRLFAMSPRTSRGRLSKAAPAGTASNRPVALRASADVKEMERCERFLVYLTEQTWTSGATSHAFAEEVLFAMVHGVPLLLVHEMPGIGGQEKRHACTFDIFFSNANGATPQELLQKQVYSQIATPLKGGALRRVAMVMVIQGLVAPLPVAKEPEAGEKKEQAQEQEEQKQEEEGFAAIMPDEEGSVTDEMSYEFEMSADLDAPSETSGRRTKGTSFGRAKRGVALASASIRTRARTGVASAAAGIEFPPMDPDINQVGLAVRHTPPSPPPAQLPEGDEMTAAARAPPAPTAILAPSLVMPTRQRSDPAKNVSPSTGAGTQGRRLPPLLHTATSSMRSGESSEPASSSVSLVSCNGERRRMSDEL